MRSPRSPSGNPIEPEFRPEELRPASRPTSMGKTAILVCRTPLDFAARTPIRRAGLPRLPFTHFLLAFVCMPDLYAPQGVLNL
jgi:hypothetical protein